MPNIKSAIKRVKVNATKKEQNSVAKSAMRTVVKKAETGLANNDATSVLEATRKLDKAVSKGLIHKNAAARKKSRLMKKANKLNA